MTLAIKNRLQVWKVVGVLLLAVALSLSAQQADFDAAAAENAATGRERLTQASADVPEPSQPLHHVRCPRCRQRYVSRRFQPGRSDHGILQ